MSQVSVLHGAGGTQSEAQEDKPTPVDAHMLSHVRTQAGRNVSDSGTSSCCKFLPASEGFAFGSTGPNAGRAKG